MKENYFISNFEENKIFNRIRFVLQAVKEVVKTKCSYKVNAIHAMIYRKLLRIKF